MSALHRPSEFWRLANTEREPSQARRALGLQIKTRYAARVRRFPLGFPRVGALTTKITVFALSLPAYVRRMILAMSLPIVDRRIRVLLADDQPVIRKMVRSMLQAEPHLDICGEAEDGAQFQADVIQTYQFSLDASCRKVLSFSLAGTSRLTLSRCARI
jgi:hypothetical protein